MNASRVVELVVGLAAVGELVVLWWVRRQLRVLGPAHSRRARPLLAGWPVAALTLAQVALLIPTGRRPVNLALACAAAGLCACAVMLQARKLRRQRRTAAIVTRWYARRLDDE